MSCSRGCCPTPRDHWLSVTISAAATPSRKPEVQAVNDREKRWDKDLPAYKSLRKQGYTPERIDGCHDYVRTDGASEGE